MALFFLLWKYAPYMIAAVALLGTSYAIGSIMNANSE